MKKTLIKILLVVFTGLLYCSGCQKTVTAEPQEITVQVDGEKVVSGPSYRDIEKEMDVKVDNIYEMDATESTEVIAPFFVEEGDRQPENIPVAGKGFGAQFIAEGVTLTPLTDDGNSSAVAWAFHGDKIAFVRKIAGGTQKKLLVMNSDGTGEEEVTQLGNPFFVQWSWGGNKLSYEFSNAADKESQGGVYVYDVRTNKSISISVPYPRGAIDPDDGAVWSVDDRYVVYKVRPGAARKRQLWVADTITGKYWQLLAERGQGKEQRWSSSLPNRMCLQIEAGGGNFDIATVDPTGRKFSLLTDIGAQSISTDNPRWSPIDDWVAFTSDIDMTQTEREAERTDCWIARPDGSEARNLTNASSPATVEQLSLGNLIWSWDGRWILTAGDRFDIQGNEIPTYYLIDPVNGGYEPIITFDPRETSEIEEFKSAKWSFDSTKIAILSKRSIVRNWGPEPEYERPRTVLRFYDVATKKVEDILVFDEELDRKEIVGDSDRDEIEEISWSPDNRSILLTVADILSKADNILKPDVYRVNLPDRYIDTTASLNNGPPMGRGEIETQPVTEQTVTETTTAEQQQSFNPTLDVQVEFDEITQIISPLHLPVAEAVASIPPKYDPYITVNIARNIILFQGPADMLERCQRDIGLVDTPPPHILVDLLAVELTDEANRNLGLDWTYSEGHFGFFQPIGNAIRDLSPDPLLDGLLTYPGVGQSLYQGVGTLPREFFIRLNTLVQDGEGTILANPRTVAMSGEESMIQIRKTLNYFFNEGFDTSGRPVVKKSDISADTEGRIIPILLADGKIFMEVDVKVGSFTFTPDAGLPEQTNRQSTTKVTVQNGETVIIGGLRQQEMNKVIVKVPILGDIPLLGFLFKKEETEIRHSVLTIFITPRVMTDDNPRPEWTTSNPDDFVRSPIIADKSETKKK
ncbi:MAG: hypothetical protein GY869_05130 [Planctomycetes bacterium]|nr:hypothetical protein [Planctomycetota bacterium]